MRQVLMTILAALLAVSACGEFRHSDPSGYRLVEVQVQVRQPMGSLPNAALPLVRGNGTNQIGTSLLFAVAENTSPVARFEDLPADNLIDSGLVNLADGTVLLTLPLETPIEFFEYTFNDSLTLNDILTSRPVAGPPNTSNAVTIPSSATEVDVVLPLTFTTFTEVFGGALSAVQWETMTAKAVSGNGRVEITANGVYNAAESSAQMLNGEASGIATNRNLQLVNQRISGTMGIISFATVDDAASGQAAPLARTAAELQYWRRDLRGSANLRGLFGAGIFINASSGGKPIASLDAYACVTASCADAEDFFASLPFVSLIPATGATPDYHFSLEYEGNGVFKGLFNGEIQKLDIFSSPDSAFFNTNAFFDVNQFLRAQFSSHAMNMYDAGDAADITAVYKNLAVGGVAPDPALPTITQAVIPMFIRTGDSATFEFGIDHSSNVNFSLAVSAGLVNGVNPYTGSHDPASGNLSVIYTAPTQQGPQTATLTLTDPGNPDMEVSGIVEFEVADTTTTPVVLLGPAIVGVSFIRTASDLQVAVLVEPGAAAVSDPSGYAWSGSATSGAISGDSPSVTFPFANGDSGSVTVLVTDDAGLQTALTITINAGDFPFNLTPEEPPAP